MSNFGSGSFGSAVFGGDPTPVLLLQIDAEMTYLARHLMARGTTDGTSLQIKQFTVGQGGFDPFNYKVALPVNPDTQLLYDPVFTSDVDYYEHPNPQNACAYCLLDFAEANYTLGEIGLWAEIQNSPIATENGTKILSAVGHFPLLAKNDSMQIALRVLSQF
jgi:hypothetical protein